MDCKLSNIISCGIYYSSIVHRGVSVSRKRQTVSFEIDVPIEKGGIAYVDGSSHDITRNMVIFAKPGQARHSKFPLTCYYVHVTIEDNDLAEALSALPDFIRTTYTESYCEIIGKLRRHFERGEKEDEIRVQSLVLELAYMLLRDGKPKEANEQSSTQAQITIDNALAYIKQNLTADLSLNAVSSHFGFSPTYFHKKFHTITRKTLHDYVEEERIKKAIEIITSTKLTLTQIAYECGFSSQSYFSYAFKRCMKMTPREYAKLAATQYEHEKTI